MDEKEILWKLGQKIKNNRKEKNIKQVDLAYAFCYDRCNMSRLESGRMNPKYTTLIKVAQKLNIPLSELTDYDLIFFIISV